MLGGQLHNTVMRSRYVTADNVMAVIGAQFVSASYFTPLPLMSTATQSRLSSNDIEYTCKIFEEEQRIFAFDFLTNACQGM